MLLWTFGSSLASMPSWALRHLGPSGLLGLPCHLGPLRHLGPSGLLGLPCHLGPLRHLGPLGLLGSSMPSWASVPSLAFVPSPGLFTTLNLPAILGLAPSHTLRSPQVPTPSQTLRFTS